MTITVSGWHEGFQKIAFTRLLRAQFGYGLSEGKSITDRIPQGEVITLQVDEDTAATFVSAMVSLGARAVHLL